VVRYNESADWNKLIIKIPDLQYNLVRKNGKNVLYIARIMKNYIKYLLSISIPIKGIKDSSHDFDQTIHRTTDVNDWNSFWSSTGSKTTDSTEWLLYQTDDSPSVIAGVTIAAFQAKYQTDDPIYPPLKVRFRVGFVPDHYHYTSELFKYDNNAEDQMFTLLPDLVVGKYIKVEFYGKPQTQEGDNKYYIALQKVSVFGESANSQQIPSEIKPTIHACVESTLSSAISQARHLSDLCTQEDMDNISEEEFKFVEGSLIDLAEGNQTLIKFMEENKINDFREWISQKRIVLLKSDLLWEHIDAPTSLGETNQFYKNKNLTNMCNGILSLIKVY
jgi:hypothetical protein